MNTLMESWPRRHRITVDEYYRMAEVGLLAPDARIELIEGEIIDMAPIGKEVSDSTLRFDRDVKVPLYARHGIVEVWIVDVKSGELCIHRRPEGGQYLDASVMKKPGITPIAALPGVEVDLSGILGG